MIFIRMNYKKFTTKNISKLKLNIYNEYISKRNYLMLNKNINNPQIISLNKKMNYKFFSSNSDKDYYEELGVSKDASDSEIKKAYFKLAKQYHPDVNSSKTAKDKFKRVGHAYSVLSDKGKRRSYDMFGNESEQYDHSQNYDTNFDYSTGVQYDHNPEELFYKMFGSSIRREKSDGPSPGSDLRASMHLSFFEAVNGCKKDIRIRRKAKCKKCSGSGMKTGTTPTVCVYCKGKGIKSVVRGRILMDGICYGCNGSGTRIEECKKCKGKTTENEFKNITVNIPAGVDSGVSVRVPNQGDVGYEGGPRGDLFIEISANSHEKFEREGSNVHLTVDIPFDHAILGTKIKIPTLNSEVLLTVKPGTQPGEVVRMAGKGIQELNRPDMGDQYVHFNVVLPKTLNKEQEKLMREFQKVSGNSNKGVENEDIRKIRRNKKKKGFFKKIFERKE